MKEIKDKSKQFADKLFNLYKNNTVVEMHKIERQKTFRINNLLETNTSRVFELLKQDGIEFRKTELSGFFQVVQEKTQLAKSKAFLQNLIYIQELSSSLPVLELDLKSGEKVLDLCASPGSKTSFAQSIANNTLKIFAVEKNRSRFFKLQGILKQYGVENVSLYNLDGNRLPFVKAEFINYFDKIICDVPCTTESKIDLRNETSLREWKLSNAKNIAKLQKGLLNSAFKMLKIGGTLVYSTCTYSIEENEEVVNWFLKKNLNAKILDIDLPLANLKHGITLSKSKELNKDIYKTVRVFPTEAFTAFYLAKITKLY